jgi:RNA polymerase sigma-70 factor (ECF subfamily)
MDGMELEGLEEIIELCRKNDRSAQGQLYAYLSPMMLGVCLRYLQSRDEAEDAMQDSFVKIFTSIKKFTGQGPVEGWARRIAVNTCLDLLKKKKRIQFDRRLSVVENNEIAEEDAGEISAEDLLKCLGEMPEGYRTIINLFAMEGYSHADIASQLGIQEGTSRSQYARARQQLIKLVKQKITISSARKA